MLTRLKFEIAPLVEEMLSQIPEEMWASTTTTFFDPAIAGGQFVLAVETKLREYGHTKKNISGRVSGCEKHQRSVQYSINKNKLVGKYYAGDFLNDDYKDMKFDVIVGNPPYQSGNGESGGKHAIWRKFIVKCFSVAKSNGYVSLVCPGFPIGSKDLGSYFSDNTPIKLENDVGNHFPGVGSDFKYWIIQLGKHNKTFTVDGEAWTTDSDPTKHPIDTAIRNKLNKCPKFECEYDGGYNSTQLKNDENDYFAKPTAKAKYPIRHASKIKVCYVTTPTKCHTKRKVMMTFSGYPGFGYFDENTPMSSCLQMSGYIEVKNKTIGGRLISLYESKLYSFLSNPDSAKGMKGKINYSLPKVDLTRKWTDEELYKHFKLTKKEIAYIEANVK